MSRTHSFLWKPGMPWLGVVSDASIAIACFSILIALARSCRKESDFRNFGLPMLFAWFVFLCGAAHVAGIWPIWDSVHRLEGFIKAGAAMISVWAAIALWPSIPRIRAFLSPNEPANADEASQLELGDHCALDLPFRQLLEAAPDAMAIVDDRGCIVLVNERCESLFGYSRQELVGECIEKLVPARLRQAHSKHRAKYAQDARPKPMGIGRELLGLRRDGSEFPVEVSLSPLQTPMGQLFSSAIRDITDRREAEMALRELNDELTLQLDDRMRQLARRAEELALSNEKLEDFAHVISHDLKGPVRGIISLTQWLVTDYAERLGDEGRHHLELIQQRASRMHDLIDGVLEYSVVIKKSEVAEELDVRSLLEELIEELSPPAGIRVELCEMPTVCYSRIQLVQIFQNLIGNAIAHMGRDTGTIRVGWQELLQNIEFSVSDDGVGIPAEHRQRIFQGFQTLASNANEQSVSLGLSTVKKIVERNGGRIYLDSRLGSGTTVRFTVPRRLSQHTAPLSSPMLGAKSDAMS